MDAQQTRLEGCTSVYMYTPPRVHLSKIFVRALLFSNRRTGLYRLTNNIFIPLHAR